MSTPLERIDVTGNAAGTEAALALALARFEKGEIVGLPTECAYAFALAVDSDDARIREKELRRAGWSAEASAQPTPQRALAALPVVTPAAARLARRYLPGPLVIVAADESEGRKVAVRVPGVALTRSFLERAKKSLLFFEPWLLDAAAPALAGAAAPDALLATYSRFRGVLLDAGPAQIGEAPAVVRADRSALEVIRPGLLTEADLRRTALKRILFVCAGNTCRSPMAAALLRLEMARRLNVLPESLAEAGFVVGSAGAYATPGLPASRGARHAMTDRGIDLSAHRSRPLTAELMREQDRIYGLTASIVDDLREFSERPRLVRHIDASGRDVSDPYGGDDETYETAAREIVERVAAIADEMLRDGEAGASSSPG